MQPRQLLAAAAPTLFALFFVGVGFFTCDYLLKRNFYRPIAAVAEVYTLGRGLVKPEKRRAVASAYYDSDETLAKLDEISWAVPTIPTPFLGSAPAPGQHGTAHINAMQFRADHEVAMPKPARTYRIFLTGGSTAYGCGAPSDATTIAGYLTARLARELTPSTGLTYEVFTMANSAWASTQERIAIENLLSELQPDMVISVSGANDVGWAARGRNILWFRSYSDEFFLSLIAAVYRVTGQPAMPENVRIEPGPIAPPLTVARLLKNVRLSAFALAEKNADYVFVLQPTLAVTNKTLTPRELAISRERERVERRDYVRESYALIVQGLATLSDEHYRFVDLSRAFDGADAAEEAFLDNVHFGDRGNERIAEGIFLNLKDRIAARGAR